MLLTLALFACTTETPAPPPAPPPAVDPSPKAPAEAKGLKATSGEISLVQLKNGTAEVGATFDTPKGTFKADGSGSFEIDLGSWDSELELRNERVRSTFFHAAEHPTATFTVSSLTPDQADMPLDSSIATSASRTGVLKGELSVYSGKTEVEIPVRLAHPDVETFVLSTTAPFQVSIEALGLNENLQALMVECAHESIGDAVDVSFVINLSPS